MATITHQKTVTIADWVQADLDAQIALGNYPIGTLLADIELPSDWNADHTLVLGADENFVTDAQLTVIGNTSNINTGDQNLFSTIAVSGQSNVVADSTSDTLTLVAGSNITITTDAGTDTITIAASGGSSAFNDITSGTNTTAAMVVGSGATLGVSGSGTIAATTLQNTRTIWGQNFNGSANVTGDITLSTANITMTGSLAATGARVTKGWFTDIESTNMPTVGGTSLSSTFQPLDADLTTIAGLTATTDNFLQAKASAWASRTPAQVTADLIVAVGDSGSGGTKGLVPAPATGDATKFLRGDMTYQTIAGGGDALTANPLSQFAATTSTQLRGVISDETGTGALVFANSPTLVTPALGTPASGTLTNCTGLPQAGTVGLTTADSPQFAGVNIGHATDTTITRTGAGDIAVEGNALYRAGGTDVAVADGGTGASTAAGARTNLGVDVKQGNVYIGTPANATIVLVSSARYAFTINSLHNLKTSSGTITAAIQINGTNVTGLSSLSVSSSASNPTASAANSVAIGDRVTLVLSSNASAADLEFTMKGTV